MLEPFTPWAHGLNPGYDSLRDFRLYVCQWALPSGSASFYSLCEYDDHDVVTIYYSKHKNYQYSSTKAYWTTAVIRRRGYNQH